MTPQDHGRAAFVALLQAASKSVSVCCPVTLLHQRSTIGLGSAQFGRNTLVRNANNRTGLGQDLGLALPCLE